MQIERGLLDFRDRDLLVAGTRPLQARLEAILARTQRLFNAMEFGLLFDVERQLLSIGYRVSDSMLDPSCYDLLASEARLASFIHCKRRSADPTLVPPWTHAHASGRQRGAPLVVRIDVRILDARAGDARAARLLAR